MKKDVFITIKGTQLVESEKDSVELTTVGQLYRRNGVYYICYDESEATGYAGAKTTLKVEGDRCVTMRRNGENMRSQLIIEKGSRHQCAYDTGYGAVTLGISGDEIVARLDDNGGHLKVNYTLDINTNTVSENELVIQIEESSHALS